LHRSSFGFSYRSPATPRRARAGRTAFLLIVALACRPTPSRAENLVVPFVGLTFKGQTTLPLFGLPTIDPSALSRRAALGVAGVWLSPGVLGAEVELAHAPRFFAREGQRAVVSSGATTLSGSLVVTAPLSVTRESLRPYLAGGLGLLHVGVSDVIGIVSVDRNLLAVNLGGGAIGMLNRRAGLRFDLRQTRSVRDDRASQGSFLLPSPSSRSRVRLSYWRATVGVTIRY
jgi:hypothetical protein